LPEDEKLGHHPPAQRHAPKFAIIREMPNASQVPEVLQPASVVYADDKNLQSPPAWRLDLITPLQRSALIHDKERLVALFGLEQVASS
jgi:hypothetical protein